MKGIHIFLTMANFIAAITLPCTINDMIMLKPENTCSREYMPANREYCVIDSSTFAYSMWSQQHECLAYNPLVRGLEFVCWSFGSGPYLNVTQTDNEFSFLIK